MLPTIQTKILDLILSKELLNRCQDLLWTILQDALRLSLRMSLISWNLLLPPLKCSLAIKITISLSHSNPNPILSITQCLFKVLDQAKTRVSDRVRTKAQELKSESTVLRRIWEITCKTSILWARATWTYLLSVTCTLLSTSMLARRLKNQDWPSSEQLITKRFDFYWLKTYSTTFFLLAVLVVLNNFLANQHWISFSPILLNHWFWFNLSINFYFKNSNTSGYGHECIFYVVAWKRRRFQVIKFVLMSQLNSLLLSDCPFELSITLIS